VVAANQEVEAANAKRQKESERSLQALQQRSSDDYSKQVCNGSLTKSPHAVVVYQTACVLSKAGTTTLCTNTCSRLQATRGPGLKGVAYTISDSDLPSAFNFSKPPPPLSVLKDTTPSPPVTPSTVMNSSSSSPLPSALAPSEPRQRGATSTGTNETNPFEGLFDSINMESTPKKASQVPKQELEVSWASFDAIRKWSVHQKALQTLVAKQNGKRRGPLPLFLGQFLVLAAYGGAGFLAFQKDEETRKAIAFMIGLAQKGYNKVQGLLPSSNNA
ncbi:hypothetical protein MMC14_010452, partial [Varicellaria rhodocarpa]|nr:hypothetical protein [Varicellaria rhodocarpa]